MVQREMRALETYEIPHGLRMTIQSMDGTFDPDVADAVMERVADGLTLTGACLQLGVRVGWVRKWILNNAGENVLSNPPRLGMRDLYQQARVMQAESWSDEIVEIADRVSPEEEQKAKLRIETRKWLMSKTDDRYQERLAIEGGRTPVRVIHSAEELRERLRERGLPTRILLEDDE